MNIGRVVQIGLHKTAEYSYLTQSNWKEIHDKQAPLKQIPSECLYNIDQWRYLGIDKEKDSILHCMETYTHPTYRNWLSYFVDSPATFMEIMDGLGIKKVDVLAMDIEGYEKSIFVEGWHKHILIPIDFIALEFHYQFGEVFIPEQDFSQRFVDAGYRRNLRVPTNIGGGAGWTIELQWIKE